MTEHQDSASTIESGDASAENNGTTALLSASPSAISLEIVKNDTTEPFLTVAGKEARWIFSSSLLVILTLVLQSSFFFVNIMTVSHLGAKELAAMSLSVTCIGVIALAPAFGLLSAMETFCSTAFTASRDKTLVGFHFQRGLISAFTHIVIVTPILWYSEDILLALKQDPDIAHLSGIYLRINLLGVLPWSMFEACKRYLQAQGIMHAGTVIAVIVAPIHYFNNFFFVHSPTYGMGFAGAPIAVIITDWLLLFGILIYIRFSKATETWGGWKVSAFHNMSAFYKLAIPAIITQCAEWTVFELLTVGASYFGANKLAANAIVMNSAWLISQISNGLGFGTSPRIGNLIGAAKPRQARIATKVAMLISGAFGLLGTLFLVSCGNLWMPVYTSDPDVIQEATKLVLAACVYLVFGGLSQLTSAVLRGLGRQKISANIFLISFYLCAVPTGYYLGYKANMQVVGLWLGICIGVIVSFSLQACYIVRYVDWSDEVRRCFIRLQSNSDSDSLVNDAGIDDSN